ncbi:MAG: hypothetical protein HC834_09975 [Rhodospirillales bacterium]|nr:hypothetical protein [Rhodospirillales bacterium]
MSRVLHEFLVNQRWYAHKGAAITSVIFADYVHITASRGDGAIAFIDAAAAEVGPERYALPLTIAWESESDDPINRLQPNVLARVRQGPNLGALYDAMASQEFPAAIVDAISKGMTFETAHGRRLICSATDAYNEYRDVDPQNFSRLGVEQSNTSLLVDNRMVLKLYRRLQEGINPEVEIGRFLTDIAKYPNTPGLLGSVELLDAASGVTAVAILQEFVRNQGDGWTFTLEHLNRALDDLDLAPPGEDEDLPVMRDNGYAMMIEVLALRIGELHRAFTLDVDDDAFTPKAVIEG